MPTAIGRQLRSKKVQLACEKRQTMYKPEDDLFKKSKSNVDVLVEQNEEKGTANSGINKRDSYDTVSSIHDIETDAHAFHGQRGYRTNIGYGTELTRIAENPNRDVTRSNSILDSTEFKASKM